MPTVIRSGDMVGGQLDLTDTCYLWVMCTLKYSRPALPTEGAPCYQAVEIAA